MSTVEPDQIITRNYTTPQERSEWWYIKRWTGDWKSCHWNKNNCPYVKHVFRTRRSAWGTKDPRPSTQALRTRVANDDNIGTLLKLTNSYLIIGVENACGSFQSEVKQDLPEIPVICTTLGGCSVIGCICVGNKYGFIVPHTVYETELKDLKENLPDSVEVKQLEEKLSALGNVIACNDKVALVHPDLDKESEEIIENTLQVEVFRHIIADNPLIGSCCVFNNHGGLVSSDISNTSLENLSSLLELNLVPGTVNRGYKNVAAGLVANDNTVYAGMVTTGHEFENIDAAFQLRRV